ncbi:MAG: Holliday junction resolvase RuvX [Ignavibacteriaceae bacterium]|jgi:putative Holliday junction resolvase
MSGENFNRFIAIDYGVKRIGVALCDPLYTFAYPFKTILNGQNLWNELGEIISGQCVVKIVLGLPVQENGKPSLIMSEVLKFKKQLENKFKIEVILRDERYTSSIAQEIILSSVTKKSKRRDKGLVDRSAAAVILQNYLDEKKP